MSTIPPVNPVPLPIGDAIAEPTAPFKGSSLEDVINYLRGHYAGYLTQTWQRFLGQIQTTISLSPTRITRTSKANQSASIASTDISGGSVSGGIYRLSYWIRVVLPAGVASTLTLTGDFIDRGTIMALAPAPAVLNGNLVTTNQSGTFLIRVDSASPIRYAIAYTSNPAAAMTYDSEITLERVAA